MDIDGAIRQLGENTRSIVRQMTAMDDRLRALPLEGKGFFVPFANYAAIDNSNITANGNPFITTVGKAMVLQTWVQSTYVYTTNNGTNYWTIEIDYYDGSTVQITTFNTSTHTNDVWTKTSTSLGGTALTSTTKYLIIGCTKTGTPGALVLPSPAVYAT